MYCYDHLGNEFRSKEERAKYYGLKPATVASRLLEGLDLKDALTTTTHERHVNGGMRAKKKNAIRTTDHCGKEYPSIVDMCNDYGISHSLYDHRLSRGWSQERALTTPVRERRPKWIAVQA